MACWRDLDAAGCHSGIDQAQRLWLAGADLLFLLKSLSVFLHAVFELLPKAGRRKSQGIVSAGLRADSVALRLKFMNRPDDRFLGLFIVKNTGWCA